MNFFDKKYIFTPGPVRMYKETLKLGSVQTPYFRNEEFSKVLIECENMIIELANAPRGSKVVFLAASGTAGMEASVINFLGKNDKAIVVNGGDFGKRFADICSCQNIDFEEWKVVNDNLENIENFKINRDVTHFLVNAHETSVGLLFNLKAIGYFCKKHNLLNIVDAISMFVTDEIDMQKHNIDVMIASSHKGLALPPGLTFLVLSPNAINKIQASDSYYFNLKSYLSNGSRGQTPFTPTVTIILQLHQRLRCILKKGIKNEIAHTKNMAEYFRSNLKSFPLSFYSCHMPNSMTILKVSDQVDALDLVDKLEKESGVIVCQNGGSLKNKVFRVSHMGNMNKEYIDVLINALSRYYEKQ